MKKKGISDLYKPSAASDWEVSLALYGLIIANNY